MNWEAVIGLEIHIQLATTSKLFSPASTAYGAPPNAQACAGDLALPGTLPVVNANAIHMAVLFGLAVGADMPSQSVFERKHYFYPDLPPGYQISQLQAPVIVGGHVDIDTDSGTDKCIRIEHAHLEADAGKSLHENFGDHTGIDLNRAGTPLIECVSEADMRTPAEAVAYARKLHTLVQYLGICDGNMQEGSFRVDANVSVRPSADSDFGTRTETKNLNSFRFMEKAIAFEIERQIDVIESGASVVQETRLYDPDADETRSMRSKEEAQDYRYFPDPDLPPVIIDAAFIDNARSELPELPQARLERFRTDYALTDETAQTLTASRALADYFEQVVAASDASARVAANWVTGALSGALNRANLAVAQSRISARQLAGLVKRIEDGTISGKIAKQVFDALWAGEGDDADAVIEARGLRQITDSSAIAAFVDEVIAAHPEQVQQYRDGRTKVIGYLVGQVMKASGGKANPAEANRVLAAKLAE